MPARSIPARVALAHDGLERGLKTHVPRHQVVRRGRIGRTTRARARPDAPRHHRHRGHMSDPEQTEQPRVDACPGAVPGLPRADRAHRRRESIGSERPAVPSVPRSVAASALHSRQLGSGTARLMNTITSGPAGPADGSPADSNLAGGGPEPATARATAGACASTETEPVLTQSPASFSAPTSHRLRPRGQVRPARRLDGLGRALHDGLGQSARLLLVQRRFLGTGADARAMHGQRRRDFRQAIVRVRCFRFIAAVLRRRSNMSVFSTAGTRSSPPTPAVPSAIPTAPRSARWDCSPPRARSPAPAGSSASGTGTSA